jgi:hypothetical protein
VRPRHVRYQAALHAVNTHGWIRTTNGAINNRGLYPLSYVGTPRMPSPESPSVLEIFNFRFAIEKAPSRHSNRKLQIENRKSPGSPLESRGFEPRTSGFKARRSTGLNYDSVQGEGFEPPCAGSEPAVLPLELSLSRVTSAPGGNRTRHRPIESRASSPLDDGSRELMVNDE